MINIWKQTLCFLWNFHRKADDIICSPCAEWHSVYTYSFRERWGLKMAYRHHDWASIIHAEWFEAKTSWHEAFPMHLFQLNNIPQRSLHSCCVLVPCCPARSAWALVCWRMIGRDCTEGPAAFLGLFRAHASEQWPSKPYEFSSSDPSLQMETWWAGEIILISNVNKY